MAGFLVRLVSCLGRRGLKPEGRDEMKAAFPVTPLSLEALSGLFARDLGETVVLGADPDIPRGAVLGLILIKEFAGRVRFGGKFPVDSVGH